MTDRLSDQDRAELRRLQQAATPGPWQHRGHWVFPAPGDESGFVAMCGDDARGHDDAAYIVAACNAIPALLEQLAEAGRERDRMAAEMAKLRAQLAKAENRAEQSAKEADNYVTLLKFANEQLFNLRQRAERAESEPPEVAFVRWAKTQRESARHGPNSCWEECRLSDHCEPDSPTNWCLVVAVDEAWREWQEADND